MAPLLAGLIVVWLAAGNIAVHAKDDTPSTVPRSDGSATALVRAASAKRPLNFEKNVGQVKGPEGQEVKFVSRGSAYTLFLTSRKAVLVLRQREGKQGKAGKASPAVVTMRLAEGASSLNLEGLDEQPGKSNYFLGNDPTQWHTGVPNYARVAAPGVYPGIDLVYHGNQGQLEYDFELAPHADPGKIRFLLEGARGLRTDSQGNLLVKVKGGELSFRRPVAYQKVGDEKRLVASRFVLKGKKEVAFRLAPYDRQQPLVIDPILSYSTFLGGSSIDGANGIAVAPDGTAFVAGGTFSTDFPTAHPLQANAGGPADFPQDAFVSKFSADGSTLLYSTYLGGKYSDVANGIAVDAAGEAFVTGTTFSPDFPVTAGSFDTLCGGDGECGATWNTNSLIVSNAFVTKLNTAGTGLVYSGFIGYYENVEGLGIAVDGNLNAYVTGATGPNLTPTVPTSPPPLEPPPPFPTIGGFETTFGGGATDAFVVKINAPGSGILYASYLGGTGQDVGYGVAVDSSAHAYVTGLTYSANFPTTDSATYTSPLLPLQGVYAGAGDAFLSKINTNITGELSLVYSTYLGGTGLDQGNAVAIGPVSGTAYVTGSTTSLASSLGFTVPSDIHFPAFQENCTLDSHGVCEGNAFVAQINPALSTNSLLYFTYLGGSLATSGTGIALDASGDAFITGSTVATNFPIAGPVFQPTYGGGNDDAFVTELNPAATGLVYSTYLGGSNTDTGSGIAIDTSGDVYVAGQTCSEDFPVAAPEQPTPGGNCDAFVSKIIPAGALALIPAGLIFSLEPLGITSPAQTVTLNNQTAAALSITSIAVTGTNSTDFAETNTCGSSVPTPGTCTISVTFTPTGTTPPTRLAQITVTDSASGSPQIVDLTGTAGPAPIVSLSSTSLDFSSPQPVGVTSTPLPLTVTNTGTAALTISNVVASSDFAVQNNNCTAALQATTPPSNCTINVTFAPNVVGSSVGSLALTDNAPNSPQIILLTGTGVGAPAVSLSPPSLTFATSQAIGTTSTSLPVTLTNTGGAALIITNVAATGDFAQTNSCGTSVAQGANCTINVTFTPTQAGNRYGSVTITDNAANSPQTLPLTGTGLSAPGVTFSPPTLTFASQPKGTPSAAQAITLTNSGTASLSITSVVATGDFSVTANTCTASLAAGGTCSISVEFTPTAVGTRTGTLTVTDNAPTSPQVVSLGGAGSDFSVAVTPTSATVVAGNSTNLTVTVSPSYGFNLQVGLACSGLPTLASCTSASATPNGTTAGTASITITTTRRTSLPPGGLRWPHAPGLLPSPSLWWAGVLALLGLTGWVVRKNRLRWTLSVLTLMLLLLVSMAACGGGGGGVGYVDTTGTPAGTYSVSITGTSGTLTNSTTLTLTVQ